MEVECVCPKCRHKFYKEIDEGEITSDVAEDYYDAFQDTYCD